MDFATKAIHHGIEPDPTTGAIMTPIFQTSTFVQHSPGKPYVDKHGQIYEYSRSHNPTRVILERNLSVLESQTLPPDVLGALCFASGLAATDALMKLLRAGDHVLKGDDLYGGSHRIFDDVFSRNGIQFTAVDMTKLDNVVEALSSSTKMVWLETPTNPLLKVTDIKAVCETVKNYNSNILCVVDNTFCSPYLQNPLDLGADIVIHSATKYIGGHSDLVMGAIICKKDVHIPHKSTETSFPSYTSDSNGNKVKDTTVYAQLKWLQNAVGAVPGILDCFLALRGIKTLHLRMEQHCKNATQIANLLKDSSKVAKVFYPGLAEHPNHEVAKQQMLGFGGMVSFILKDDNMKAAASCMEALNAAPNHTFKIAESLGGVESLANHPLTMTHAAMKAADREKLGISAGLIRLSVGIESPNDLIKDVQYALDQIS